MESVVAIIVMYALIAGVLEMLLTFFRSIPMLNKLAWIVVKFLEAILLIIAIIFAITYMSAKVVGY